MFAKDFKHGLNIFIAQARMQVQVCWNEWKIKLKLNLMKNVSR